MLSSGSTLQYLVYHCLEPVPTIVEVPFGTPPQAIVQAVTTMGGRFGDDRVGGFVVEVWVEEMNGWVDASVRIEELVARRKVRVAAALNPPALPQLPPLPHLSAAPTVPPVATSTDFVVGTAPNPPALPELPDLSSVASASPAVPPVGITPDTMAVAANSPALPQLPPLPDPSGVDSAAPPIAPAVDAQMEVKMEVLKDILQRSRDGTVSSSVHNLLRAARRDLFEERECRYVLIELATANLVAIKYTVGTERKIKLTEHATADELLEGIMHASETGRIRYGEMTSTMARVRPDLFSDEEQQHASIEKAVEDNRLFVSGQDVDGHVFVSLPTRHRGGALRQSDNLAEIVASKGGSVAMSDLIEEGVKLLHERMNVARLSYSTCRDKTLGAIAVARDQGLFVMFDNGNVVPLVKLGPAWRGVDHSKGPTAEEYQKVLDVIVEQVASGSAKTLVELEQAVEKRFPDLCRTKMGRDAFIQKAAAENRIRVWDALHDQKQNSPSVAISGSDRDELDREFGVLVDVMRNRPNGMTFADVSEELKRRNPRRFRDQRDADTLIRRAIDHPFLVTLDQPGDPLMLTDEASHAQIVRSLLKAYVKSRGIDYMEMRILNSQMRRAKGNVYCWKARRDAAIEELVGGGELFRWNSDGGECRVSLRQTVPTDASANACPLSSTIRNRNVRAVVKTIEDHGENGVMNEADAKRKLSQLRQYRSAKKCDKAFDEALSLRFVVTCGRSDIRIVDRRTPENASSDAKRQRSPPRPAEDEAPLVLPQYKPPPFAGSGTMPVAAPLPQYVPPSHQPGPAAPLVDFNEGLPMALPRLEEPPTVFGAGGGPPQQ